VIDIYDLFIPLFCCLLVCKTVLQYCFIVHVMGGGGYFTQKDYILDPRKGKTSNKIICVQDLLRAHEREADLYGSWPVFLQRTHIYHLCTFIYEDIISNNS
ncbi:hypothetical protein ACJX0J_031820, partial [Zea mays]